MTLRPLIEAQDEDIRNALFALQRAAYQAKKIATQTQTSIVIMREGIMVHEQPSNNESFKINY